MFSKKINIVLTEQCLILNSAVRIDVYFNWCQPSPPDEAHTIDLARFLQHNLKKQTFKSFVSLASLSTSVWIDQLIFVVVRVIKIWHKFKFDGNFSKYSNCDIKTSVWLSFLWNLTFFFATENVQVCASRWTVKMARTKQVPESSTDGGKTPKRPTGRPSKTPSKAAATTKKTAPQKSPQKSPQRSPTRRSQVSSSVQSPNNSQSNSSSSSSEDFLGRPPSDDMSDLFSQSEQSSARQSPRKAAAAPPARSAQPARQRPSTGGATPKQKQPRKQTKPKKRTNRMAREIREYQNSTKLLIPRLPFQR